MGNCLFVAEKPIRIVKPDGKILEYKSPTRVFQVLSDFSGHAISDAVPVTHHLQQTAKLISGHLYFLIPTAGPEASEKKAKKTVRFAEPEKETGSGGGVVRIKVVMTKTELEEMVERGGITAEEMICKIKNGSGEVRCRSDMEDEEDEDEETELQRWKPELRSIPESEVAC